MSYFSGLAEKIAKDGDVDLGDILEINHTIVSWSMKSTIPTVKAIYHYVEPSIKECIDQDQRPLFRTIFSVYAMGYKLAVLRLFNPDVLQAKKIFSPLNEAILSCQLENRRRCFGMEDVESILRKIDNFESHLKGLTRMEINDMALNDLINEYGLNHDQSLNLSQYVNKPTVANIFVSTANQVDEENESDVPWNR